MTTRLRTEDLICNPKIVELKEGLRDILKILIVENEDNSDTIKDRCDFFLKKLEDFDDIEIVKVKSKETYNNSLSVSINYIYGGHFPHNLTVTVTGATSVYSHSKVSEDA